MSYVSVVSFGLGSFIIMLWFTTKRKTFKGPKIDFELLKARRDAALTLEGTDPRRTGSTSSQKVSFNVKALHDDKS